VAEAGSHVTWCIGRGMLPRCFAGTSGTQIRKKYSVTSEFSTVPSHMIQCPCSVQRYHIWAQNEKVVTDGW